MVRYGYVLLRWTFLRFLGRGIVQFELHRFGAVEDVEREADVWT